MAFKHGRLAEIKVNAVALSTFCDTADINIKIDTADVTTFTAAWKSYITGLAGGTVVLSGDYDPTVTTGPASVLFGMIATNQGGTSTPILFYPAGNNAAQGTLHTFNALITDYKEAAKTNGAVRFDATLLVTGVDTVTQL